LRRIIRPLLIMAIFVSILLAIVVDGERTFVPFYLYAHPKYHVYLEELKTMGQGSFPGLTYLPEAKVEDSVAKILGDKMRSWSQKDIRKLSKHIVRLSEKYQFSPIFVLSLIEVESRFRTDVISHRGAIGLMQVKLNTAEPIAQQLAIQWDGAKSLMDPRKNIEVALHYMDELRQKFKNPRYYLAAYNQGPTRVNKALRMGEDLSNVYYNKVVRSYRRYTNDTMTGRY